MTSSGARAVWVGVLLAWVASACGYRAGISIAPDYPSVGIEIFGRDGRGAPVRNIERDLHEELVRSTRNLVDAELRRPSEARLVMRGTIESYRRRPGVRNSDNQQLETGIQVIVRAELWDRSSSKVVSGPITASKWVGYTLDAQDAELKARTRLLHNLGDRIVLELMTELADPAAGESSRESPASGEAPAAKS